MVKNIKARICLFPIGHGGRDSPFMGANAQLGIVFPEIDSGMHFSAKIEAIGNQHLELGTIQKIKVRFFNEVDIALWVKKGERFELFEGAKQIGVGVWH